MGLGLLLIPALGGYLFVTNFNRVRDRVARESGYHVFLRSALVGAVLLVPARAIALVVDMCLPGVSGLWKTAFPLDFSGTVAITVLIGLVSPHLLNFVFQREDAWRKTAFEISDHIGLLVDQAIDESRFIEVSLTSGKSYVGMPLARTFFSAETAATSW